MITTPQIGPAMFREIARRVETLTATVHWSFIAEDHCMGRAPCGSCFMQTYDQPGRDGLLFSTHILPLPLPPATEREIEMFIEETSRFLYPKIAAMLMKDEQWRAVSFKNVVFPGETGYTDAKLISLCEINFSLGPQLAQCLIAIHQQRLSLQQAAESFGASFMSLMKSKDWMFS